MKYKYKNTSPLCDKAIKKILRFTLKSLTKLNKGRAPNLRDITFRTRRSAKYSGRCWSWKGRVLVGFKAITEPFTMRAYRKRGSAGENEINDVYELAVWITAHELWHATGCHDEDSCELSAHHVCHEWRKLHKGRVTEWMDERGFRPKPKTASKKKRKSRIPENVNEALKECNKTIREGSSVGGSTEVYWNWDDNSPLDTSGNGTADWSGDFGSLRQLRGWIAKNGCDNRTVDLYLCGWSRGSVKLSTDKNKTPDELIGWIG